MSEKEHKQYATVQGLARLAGVSRKTVRKYAKAGIIESRFLTNGWRVFPNAKQAAATLRDVVKNYSGEREKMRWRHEDESIRSQLEHLLFVTKMSQAEFAGRVKISKTRLNAFLNERSVFFSEMEMERLGRSLEFLSRDLELFSKLIPQSQAGDYLGCSRQAVSEAARCHRLPSTMIGGKRFFTKQDLDVYRKRSRVLKSKGED